MKRIYLLAVITVLPIAFTSFIWLEVVRGVASRAVDGSGHFGIAQVYDQSIFPDTFGWTNSYFAGMSFPNFYPPLFFWVVSFLHHTQLLTFVQAFKLVVALPLLLVPLATWSITWVHAGRNDRVATGAAVASATLSTLGEIFQPNTGLDMSSTLLDGFYTQPLGFLLLLVWILFYLFPRQRSWHFATAAILLALTVLANFFNAITAIIFIASVLSCDAVKWLRASDGTERQSSRNTFLVHFASPWVAVTLTAFWTAPMLSSWEYLVTKPLIKPIAELMTIPLWCWYALASLGGILWLRRPVGRIGPYLISSLVLLIALVFSGWFAPSWFPLQVFRFFSTVNFLLCVPVGIALAYVVSLYSEKRFHSGSRSISEPSLPVGPWKHAAIVGITVVILLVLGMTMAKKKLTQASAFYTSETFHRIEGALEFAKRHKDGRYLVEVLPPRGTGLVRADSLALNAYLGAQGNETISIVYREASPNSRFFNAQLNAFSSYRENFGISSALMDDQDFINQPLAQHIKRLIFIGVRYIVIGTPEMKTRLAREQGVGARHDVGEWSIFELSEATLPNIRSLKYLPALVVSNFTVKLRKQEQLDFLGLAEEQFSDAWFDVLMVRSEETSIDSLEQMENFGALILANYKYRDEAKAITRLKEFAKTRTLVLLSEDSPFFSRLKSEIHQFKNAVVIEKTDHGWSNWIEHAEPSRSYESSSVRNTWRAIRRILEENKIESPQVELHSQVRRNQLAIAPVPSTTESQPVLIAQTFHPKWIDKRAGSLYATTPFFTLAMLKEPMELTFQRSLYDRIALWLSLSSLIAVLSCFVFGIFSQLRQWKTDYHSGPNMYER